MHRKHNACERKRTLYQYKTSLPHLQLQLSALPVTPSSNDALNRLVIAFCVSFSSLSSLCSIPFFKSQFGFFGARLISSFRYSIINRTASSYTRHIRRFFHRSLVVEGRFVDDNRIHSLLQICIRGHIISESDTMLWIENTWKRRLRCLARITALLPLRLQLSFFLLQGFDSLLSFLNWIHSSFSCSFFCIRHSFICRLR